VKDSIVWFGNIAVMEHDIKVLAVQGDVPAKKVMRVVGFCKWSIVLNIIMIILIAIFSNEIDLFFKKYL